MTVITIEFGALVRPIKAHLEEQGVYLKGDDLKRFEEIAYSITFLHLQHIVPDSVRDNARKKLMKKISVAIHAADHSSSAGNNSRRMVRE